MTEKRATNKKDIVQLNVRIYRLHKKWLDEEKRRTGHSLDRVARDVIRAWRKNRQLTLELEALRQKLNDVSYREQGWAQTVVKNSVEDYQQYLLEQEQWPPAIVHAMFEPLEQFLRWHSSTNIDADFDETDEDEEVNEQS